MTRKKGRASETDAAKTLTLDFEPGLSAALEALDFDQAHRQYWEQNEFLFLERFVPPEIVDRLLAEANIVRPDINRNYVPSHKKGGSVSYYTLHHKAPAILALYRSSAFRTFLSRLTESELLLCPEDDPHSCALYFYTEPGDHIGFHYDTSYYKGDRYTVLIGLVERSEHCRLVARLYKDRPNREIREIRIPMESGSMVVFNGDRLWHAVTPLEAGGERVILTLQYVTDQRMGPVKQLFSNMKDAFAYFGPAVFLQRNPSRKRA